MLRSAYPTLAFGLTAAGALLFTAAERVQAGVTPITTTVRAQAYALVAPNPDHPGDLDVITDVTGDFAASAYQIDTSGGGAMECEVTSDSIAHIDASGATGTAGIDIRWVGINTHPPGTPNAYGVFGSQSSVYYSFITDATAEIALTVTTTSNVGGGGAAVNAMEINHVVTFNGQWTELPLNGVVTLNYSVGAGFHQILLEHYPNSGIFPWPNVDATANTALSFTIDADDPVIVRGDMNCDGQLDFFDIDGFLMAIFDIEGYYIQYPECSAFNADINNDESVDFFDIDGFLACLFGECL